MSHSMRRVQNQANSAQPTPLISSLFFRSPRLRIFIVGFKLNYSAAAPGLESLSSDLNSALAPPPGDTSGGLVAAPAP